WVTSAMPPSISAVARRRDRKDAPPSPHLPPEDPEDTVPGQGKGDVRLFCNARNGLPTPFLPRPLFFSSPVHSLPNIKTPAPLSFISLPAPFSCPSLPRLCAPPLLVELATATHHDPGLARPPWETSPAITAPAAGRPRGQRPRPGGPGLP